MRKIGAAMLLAGLATMLLATVALAGTFHWERVPNWNGDYVTCLVSDTSGATLYCR